MYPEKRFVDEQGRTKIQDVIDSASRSKPMMFMEEKLAKLFSSKLNSLSENYLPASDQIERKAKHKASEFGLDPASIKVYSTKVAPGGKDAVGFSENGGKGVGGFGHIIIDENQTRRALAHTINHEMQHVRHNDSAGSVLAVATGGVAGAISGYKGIKNTGNSFSQRLPKRFAALLKIGTALFPLLTAKIGSSFAADKHTQYKEKRADTLALYGTGSAKKVLDFLPYAKHYKPDASPYISKTELLEIARHLVDQGKGDGITHEIIHRKAQMAKSAQYALEMTGK